MDNAEKDEKHRKGAEKNPGDSDTILGDDLPESRGDGAPDPEAYLHGQPELARELKELFRAVSGEGSARKPSGKEPDRGEMQGAADRVIGDFRIIREIGSGGMSTVYEAEQISLKRRVALKVLSPPLSFSSKAVEQFRQEAEAAGRQSHPGIVSIFTIGESEGVYYIAQELVGEGHTLSEQLEIFRKKGELPAGYFREAARLIGQIADALGHAHASGVIHRDVKPSNILLTQEFSPRVSDFGLARVEDGLPLSRTGEFSGTPFYTSPEQAAGKHREVDHRTDIYSLGATLYETLTLKRPVEGATSQEVLRNILSEEPRSPDRVNPRVPRDLSIICLKAMEKDPKHRYQTMADLAGDLQRFLLGEPILARRAGWIRRSFKWILRHRMASLTLAATLLFLAALSVVVFQHYKQRWQKDAINRERYKILKEALGWPTKVEFGTLWSWCIWADHQDPSGYMLKALLAIEAFDLEEAILSLKECVTKSREREERFLERDAHYLLGLIRYRLEQGRGIHDEERTELLKGTENSLEKAGDFDPYSPDTLVWRPGEQKQEEAQEKAWYLLPIKLNADHYIIHLYHGIALFQILYTGGDRREFEEAIQHFETVLQKRPDNIVALTYLGRVQYFYATFYNFFHLLDKADKNLERASRLKKSQHYHLTYATLGQIALLRGDLDRARKSFERAIELGETSEDPTKRKDPNVHNDYRGLGEVYASEGRLEEARALFMKAFDLMPGDPYVNVALAELDLYESRLTEALEHATIAAERPYGGGLSRESLYAPAFLVRARIRLKKGGDLASVTTDLNKILDISVDSPRDLSLTTLLIAGLPEKDLSENLKFIARRCASDSILMAQDAPLCNSASGAAKYLDGLYEEALARLAYALEAREEWPREVRKNLWTEDARDYFLMAMAHAKLARKRSDDGALESARECFDKGEALYVSSKPPFSCFDLLERIRGRAKALLNSPD